MPAIPPRPDKPSFYPDTSTLNYAFEGHEPDASPGRRDLLDLVEKVAREANLCLSLMHILELIGGKKRDERLARARWLDALQVVWLRDHDEVQILELERFLRKSAGLLVEPLSLPAAPSLLATFRLRDPAQLADVLLGGNIARLAELWGDSEKIRNRVEKFREVGPVANVRLFKDRQTAAQRLVSEDEVRVALKAKVDRSLRASALVVNRQLAARDPQYCIRKGSLYVPPGDDFVMSKMQPLDEIRDDLPFAFTFHETLRNVGERVARKQGVDSEFFRNDDRKSDVGDWYHLLGAAYCDAFTCDGYTSKCLGNVRNMLGRSKEVVYRGDDLLFVREISGALRL